MLKVAKYLSISLLLWLGLCYSSIAQESEWISLFNGKDLNGWTPKIVGYESGDNFGNTFRVEDGLIKVAYDAYDKFDGRFGHLFQGHKSHQVC